MTYIRGKNIKVFITTEHATASINLSGATASVGTGSTGFSAATAGVGKLGACTGYGSVDQIIKFVEGIDVSMGWEDQQDTFFGGAKEYHIPHRKKFEITITRKAEDKNLAKLADSARWGVNSTNSLNSGCEELTSISGYRLYVYDGTNYDVFYHGIIPAEGYTETPDPSKALVQTIKFVGNDWSTSLGSASIIISSPIE